MAAAEQLPPGSGLAGEGGALSCLHKEPARPCAIPTALLPWM